MRWCGARWRIHPLFLALLAVSAPAGLLGEALLLFVLLLGHELAHIIVARCFGLDVEEIEIWPFGGVARIPGLALADASVEGLVAVAGPLHNLLLLAAGIAAETLIASPSLSSPSVSSSYWLDLFIWGNLSLAGLNLLPAWPLDGGRALHALLRKRIGPRHSLALLSVSGRMLAVALAGAGVGIGLSGRWLPNLLLLGLFLWLSAGRSTGAELQGLAGLWRRRERLAQQQVLPIRHLLVRADLPVGRLIPLLQPEHYYIIRVCGENLRILGELNEQQLYRGVQEGGWSRPVGELLGGGG